MKRMMLAAVVASTAVLAACGGGEVVVQAQIEGAEGQPVPLGGLEVRAMPYDRDAIFDSLAAAYAQPEPPIPAELSLLQDSIAAANESWTNATATWNSGRDSLATLTERLEGMPRTSGEYIVLFNEVNALFEEVAAAERTMNQQFNRFTSLQTRYTTSAEETQRIRAQWGDAAFADYEVVIAARLNALRMEEVVDTTDANGLVQLTGLDEGEWWIHARYELPFDELYWNVPITAGADPVQVQLTRENAEVRPKL